MNQKKSISKDIKRIITAICISTFIGISSLSVQAAQVQNITANTTAYLNIRSNAGTNYSIVTCVDKNTSLTVIDRINNNWLKVKTKDGVTGYCHADYLDIKTNIKTATYLNLRQGPGTNYKSISTIPPNVILDILRFYDNSWVKVKTSDGKIGYVCTNYDYVTYVSDNIANTVAQDTLKLSVLNKNVTVGESFTITTSNSNVSWKSSNTNIASVDKKGLVTGIKAGTTIITATDNHTSNSASCKVTVSGKKVSIELPSYNGTLTVGEKRKLNPKLNTAGVKLIYSTSLSNIASVDNSGLITAKSAGSCNITIKDSASAAKAVYKLTVKANDSIKISASDISIKEGASQKLTVSPSNNIKWYSSDNNILSVRNGVVSALTPGRAVVTASNGSVSVKCQVTVTDMPSNGLSLTRTSETITAGKTLYIKGNASSKIWWNVSDSNVISINRDVSTNNKGFIVANSPGKAAVTYTDANGHRAVCVITVKKADPVKFTYSSPNSAIKNTDVKLIAITDKNRKDVYFEVNENGNKVTVKSNNKTEDGNTYVWTGTYHTKSAGIFEYKAYAKDNNGKTATCDDAKADIYVSDKTNIKTTTCERLRASDEVIDFIGEKEGFVSSVVPDRLAGDIPTLAHGYVVWEGDKFYNGLTRKEAYALLVSAVNKENYTRDVNNMLINNNVNFNQQQFDSLVSFSYNLGTGWTYGSDLKNILLNSYGSKSVSNKTTARVNVDDGLNLRESYTTNSKILDVLGPNETVTLVDSNVYNSIWYKVKTSNGKVGYCSGTYLIFATNSSAVRDLNCVNKNALIKEMLAYHHAGGICYYGLLYRRADELEMFLYGNYTSDGYKNNYNFPDPYCIKF